MWPNKCSRSHVHVFIHNNVIEIYVNNRGLSLTLQYQHCYINTTVYATLPETVL